MIGDEKEVVGPDDYPMISNLLEGSLAHKGRYSTPASIMMMRAKASASRMRLGRIKEALSILGADYS